MLPLQIHIENLSLLPRGVAYVSRLWLYRSWKLVLSCGYQGSHNLIIKTSIPKSRVTSRKKKKEAQFSPTLSFTEVTATLALFSNQSAGRQNHSQVRQGDRLFPLCCLFPQANILRDFKKLVVNREFCQELQ